MNVYVDSSVLLRVILAEPQRLPSWTRIDQAMSSELIRLEALRTIDRARITFGLADEEVARRRAAMLETLDGFGLIPVSMAVLERAAEPFPTLIGSLDAIHLATALLIRERFEQLSFATHDLRLALAAKSVGFVVEGVSA